jgi:hypothetical protein
VEPHELAWAEALAQEHSHQGELLATLHSELSAFAAESANALTALEALVSLGPVAALLDSTKTTAHSVALVRDVTRRLPALARSAPHDEALSGFYTHLGDRRASGGDLSPAVVHQAGELLRTVPDRADAVFLNAIVDAAGDRAMIRHALGPAAVTALSAIAPIAHWSPSLATIGGDGTAATVRDDLATVLHATADAADVTLDEDSAEVADSLRYTVQFLRDASHAISRSSLEGALAAAREQLNADLDELRAIYTGAQHAAGAWRNDRQVEHAELVAEVHEKLDKVEKILGALARALPQLQLAARALTTVEKARDVNERIDARFAAGVDAVRMSLLLTVNDVAAACLPESRHAVRQARPLPKRWLLGAAAVLAVAGAAIAITLIGNGSGKTTAPNTILNVVPQLGTPSAPTVSPLRATFDPAQKATFYSISVTAARQGKLIYSWRLDPPADNRSCNSFGSVLGSPNRAVWRHAVTDGCTHAGGQHPGTVTVTVRSRYWQCSASFVGSLTAAGAPPKACTRT